ncbi:MAG: hypothetical protein MJZ34_07485 [Paludibacteraceae bacterium]|nr:hypothetical protein [Paludibacteraceae bacterium]
MSTNDFNLLKTFINKNHHTKIGSTNDNYAPIKQEIVNVTYGERIVEKEVPKIVEKIVEKKVPLVEMLQDMSMTDIQNDLSALNREISKRSIEICSIYMNYSIKEWHKHFDFSNNNEIKPIWCCNRYGFKGAKFKSDKYNGVDCIVVFYEDKALKPFYIPKVFYDNLNNEKALKNEMLKFITFDINSMKKEIYARMSAQKYLNDL